MWTPHRTRGIRLPCIETGDGLYMPDEGLPSLFLYEQLPFNELPVQPHTHLFLNGLEDFWGRMVPCLFGEFGVRLRSSCVWRDALYLERGISRCVKATKKDLWWRVFHGIQRDVEIDGFDFVFSWFTGELDKM